MRLKVALFVAIAAAVSGAASGLGQTSMPSVTVETRKGDLLNARLSQLSTSSIELDVSGQRVQLPISQVKYISFVGPLTVGVQPVEAPTGGRSIASIPPASTAPIGQAAASSPATTKRRIIGNRNSGIYHLPDICPDYDRVAERNRVYFTTEAEAQAAGFRKAKNCRS